MKSKWEKSQDGASLPSYSLSKEYSPDWFASVFANEGKYTFRFGRRGGNESYFTSQKFTSAESAKKKALELLSQKIFLKP